MRWYGIRPASVANTCLLTFFLRIHTWIYLYCTDISVQDVVVKKSFPYFVCHTIKCIEIWHYHGGICITTRRLLNFWLRDITCQYRVPTSVITRDFPLDGISMFLTERYNNGPDTIVVCIIIVIINASCCLKTMRPRQDCRHFQDAIFKSFFVKENIWISIQILLKCVPGVKLTIFQHWFRKWLGAEQVARHYFNRCLYALLSHICVTRPQWVFKKSEFDNPSCRKYRMK